MQKQSCQERTFLEEWSCKDVDIVYEKINKVGSGTYGYYSILFDLLTTFSFFHQIIYFLERSTRPA